MKRALLLTLAAALSAGLSGVVNATIAFDKVVHNTLWIVGHFHQMALLNIGFVAFAAVYAWLPDWVGHPLYSERMAHRNRLVSGGKLRLGGRDGRVGLPFAAARFQPVGAAIRHQLLAGGPDFQRPRLNIALII